MANNDTAGRVVLRFKVKPEHSASRFGRQHAAVLATPDLLTWMELAACACCEPLIPVRHGTVGFKVDLVHSAPVPIGATVEVAADLTRQLEALLLFEVTARHRQTYIAKAVHQRKIVPLDR